MLILPQLYIYFFILTYLYIILLKKEYAERLNDLAALLKFAKEAMEYYEGMSNMINATK